MQGFMEADFSCVLREVVGDCGPMDKTTLLTKLPSRKGSFATVRTDRPAKTRKGFDGNLRKVSVMQLRLGHNYYAQESTRSAHESGERAIADPSALWHKAEGSHPALRVHKAHPAKVYLAGQPVGNPAVSTFFLDGKEVERSEVETFLLASEKKEKSTSDHVMIAIETITSIR